MKKYTLSSQQADDLITENVKRTIRKEFPNCSGDSISDHVSKIFGRLVSSHFPSQKERWSAVYAEGADSAVFLREGDNGSVYKFYKRSISEETLQSNASLRSKYEISLSAISFSDRIKVIHDTNVCHYFGGVLAIAPYIKKTPLSQLSEEKRKKIKLTINRASSIFLNEISSTHKELYKILSKEILLNGDLNYQYCSIDNTIYVTDLLTGVNYMIRKSF